MVPFQVKSDVNGIPTDAYLQSDFVNAYVLAANTAVTVTVPAGATLAVFQTTADYYIKATGTSAVPLANVTDGTASMLRPGARYVKPGQTFSIVSPTACTVTIAYFS